MVVLSDARWIRVPSDPQADVTQNCHQRVFPPVPMLGTTAACIDDGLFETPQGRTIQAEATAMEAKCDLAICSICRDGAKANSKAIQYIAQKRLPKTLLTDMICILHIINHIQTWVIAVSGILLLGRIYSMSLLLTQGGFGVRLLLTLQSVLDANLIIDYGEVPIDAASYTSELIGFLTTQYSYNDSHIAKLLKHAGKARKAHWLRHGNSAYGEGLDMIRASRRR